MIKNYKKIKRLRKLKNMKDDIGFTLVELLGVILILAIIMGIAIATFVGINNKVDVAYYKEVEQSAMFSGGEYYAYSEDNMPSIFGDQKTVTLKFLKENGFLNDDIKNKQGDSCNLEESFVGAYKDSIDRTNYFVCLKCGEYNTNSKECNGKVDYSLRITAKKKTNGEIVDKNGKEWLNDNVILTFETLNDMEDVYVELQDGTSKSCHLDTRNGIKTCTIEIDKSGNYNAYAKGKGKETRKEKLIFQIDKTGPLFDIQNTGNKNTIKLDLINSNTDKINVSNLIYNIRDNESGIKIIEYSFEKESDKDKFVKVDIKDSFSVVKDLNPGTYKLKVRITNNANMVTTKEITYTVFKKISLETEKKLVCNNLTYNGNSQTLVNTYEGLLYKNNTGINAGTYKVTIGLKDGYIWNDETVNNRTLNCTINKANINLTLDKTSDKITKNKNITFKATSNVEGVFSNTISNNNVSVSPESQTGTSETVTVTGKNIGTADVTVTLTPNSSNYNPASKVFKADVSKVKYMILYEQLANDGVNFTTVKTIEGEGEINSKITGTVYSYDGFESPPPITITLVDDENKNIIEYKYKRLCYGDACDYCGMGDPMGSCFYKNRNELGLWSSGLGADNNNQNVRYTGGPSTTHPKNYICFANNCNHRIIGIFGSDHTLRLIGPYDGYSRWAGGASNYYDSSDLKKNLDNYANSIYDKAYIKSGVTYSSLIVARGRGMYQTSGTRLSLSRTERQVPTYSAATILNVESGAYRSYKYWPVALSDILLSNKITGSFRDNAWSVSNNTWLFRSGGSEFSFHLWNGNYAYYMGSSGNLCGNTSSDADYYTKNCSSKYSGWYTNSWHYRINFNLDPNVLFCGGSGTTADP